MIYEVPAWGRTLGTRIAAKPKMHSLDSGIASRLAGLTENKLLTKDPSAISEFGHIMESFVVSEILKELSWLDDTFLVGQWHTLDNVEVDIVLERMDGAVYGFEIKTAGRLNAADFSGLDKLKTFAGTSFKAGFVLYGGAQSFKQEDRIYAVPIGKLWG
jgi:predicted AAA+ superfamily ATPase